MVQGKNVPCKSMLGWMVFIDVYASPRPGSREQLGHGVKEACVKKGKVPAPHESELLSEV